MKELSSSGVSGAPQGSGLHHSMSPTSCQAESERGECGGVRGFEGLCDQNRSVMRICYGE